MNIFNIQTAYYSINSVVLDPAAINHANELLPINIVRAYEKCNECQSNIQYCNTRVGKTNTTDLKFNENV